MTALWQSSQRPMYIRTVWIDGFRHAILTHDDPYFLKLCARRRRPHTSTSYFTSKPIRDIKSSISDNNKGSDTQKLHLMIKNVKGLENTNTVVEKLDLSDVNCFEDDVTISSSQQSDDITPFQEELDNENMRTAKTNRTACTDVQENTDLSDRVLQWLDLAGKVDLLAPEMVERMTLPRHSWPELQRRNLIKSKTTTELRFKEGKAVCASKLSGNIDRQDFYMPTSANTIENYARKSRNVKNTPRRDTKVKENRKVKDISTNITETRQKMITERTAVQKQYAEMISKKLIPDLSTSKRQVHIFIPEAMAKKYGSTTQSRTESLLSQVS